jgi:hypothetical protein
VRRFNSIIKEERTTTTAPPQPSYITTATARKQDEQGIPQWETMVDRLQNSISMVIRS